MLLIAYDLSVVSTEAPLRALVETTEGSQAIALPDRSRADVLATIAQNRFADS